MFHKISAVNIFYIESKCKIFYLSEKSGRNNFLIFIRDHRPRMKIFSVKFFFNLSWMIKLLEELDCYSQ